MYVMLLLTSLHNIIKFKQRITSASDDHFCIIFSNFPKKSMIFKQHHLPSDDSHKIIMPYLLYTEGKRLAISYNGLPIGDLFSIRSFFY